MRPSVSSPIDVVEADAREQPHGLRSKVVHRNGVLLIAFACWSWSRLTLLLPTLSVAVICHEYVAESSTESEKLVE